jgi:hypothetical protein
MSTSTNRRIQMEVSELIARYREDANDAARALNDAASKVYDAMFLAGEKIVGSPQERLERAVIFLKMSPLEVTQLLKEQDSEYILGLVGDAELALDYIRAKIEYQSAKEDA